MSDEITRKKPDETVYAVGFSLWKRQHVLAFFCDRKVIFIRKPSQLPKNKLICAATWGVRIPNEHFPPLAQIIRLEDGFLRSVGLGADLVRPMSWVRDTRGIYYDASGPSDLEHLLHELEFPVSLIQRAQKLRQDIVAAELTKYNTGKGVWLRPKTAKRVILVPGQVESDASIQRGAIGIKTNLDLLKQARGENPDAYIIYKPHPDVVAGLRIEGNGEADARGFCDEVVGDIAMSVLLNQVDEVHTLTSLTGFEALMRGKKVVAYGMPFYAGWGLTEDRAMSEAVAARRKRKLTLDQLVAAALILYPTYVSRETGRFSTAEVALRELLDWRDKRQTAPAVGQHILRFLLQFLKH
jgi:capsular polysaccharide export protein